MFKMPGTVTAPFVAGMGLALTISLAACSQGGPVGYKNPSQGGTDGAAPTCIELLSPSAGLCNTGDQQVTAGPGLASSGSCPPERECYTLQSSCGPVLCLLPDGVHCDDPLSCNPGDTQTAQWGPDCVGYPSPCYTKYLCAQSITCNNSASPYGGICSGTWTDGGVLEPPDASADGGNAGRKPCCGDGIVDIEYGEQCDMGSLNGVSEDCTSYCTFFIGP
jgi:hypothetical protein